MRALKRKRESLSKRKYALNITEPCVHTARDRLPYLNFSSALFLAEPTQTFRVFSLPPVTLQRLRECVGLICLWKRKQLCAGCENRQKINCERLLSNSTVKSYADANSCLTPRVSVRHAAFRIFVYLNDSRWNIEGRMYWQIKIPKMLTSM